MYGMKKILEAYNLLAWSFELLYCSILKLVHIDVLPIWFTHYIETVSMVGKLDQLDQSKWSCRIHFMVREMTEFQPWEMSLNLASEIHN